jgi:hypothetical protein
VSDRPALHSRWPLLPKIEISSNGQNCSILSQNVPKFELDTILKGTHPGTIPARFGLIWFSGFRREHLNVIFYQNIPNLHNRYISAERKISQKTRLKIAKRGDEILIVHCCFSVSQNELKF